MPVFVDDAMIPANVRNGARVVSDQWSHLTATTPRELHSFATRTLGLQRSYFQDKWPYPHYDVTSGMRQQALLRGATPVTYGDPAALELGRWLPPVLVTASRGGLTRDDVAGALRPRFDPRKVLISGGARGGDRLAESLWQLWGGEIDRHTVTPDDWDRSRQAGHDRNGVMVTKARQREGEAVAIWASCSDRRCPRIGRHGSHGTADCIRKAQAAGLDIGIHRITPAAQRERHTWQPVEGDPDRMSCECEVTAHKLGQAGGGYRVEYEVPGFPPTPERPPCFTAQDRVRTQSAPQPAQGSHARRDGGVWLGRFTGEQAACSACTRPFIRAQGVADSVCLTCESQQAMREAGVTAAEVAPAAEYNRQVLGAGALGAQVLPGRTEPAPDKPQELALSVDLEAGQ